MGISRRKAIIGLGTLVGGTGALAASGAFDAVEAQRSFEVDVAGDANALLGLEAVNTAIAGTEEGGAGGNDILFFELNDDEVEESNLNDNAVTDFFAVFRVTNNGSEDQILITMDTGDVDGVTFRVVPGREDNDDVVDGVINLEADDTHDDGLVLDPGQSVVVDLRIDTTPAGGYVEPEDGEPYDMTIVAQSEEAAAE